jgi:hypothetical protein
MTTGIGSYLPASCAALPTLLSTEFDPVNNNSTGVIHEYAPFDNAPFGGFVVSGMQYETKVCLNIGACKFVNVYSGESVSQDNWLFGQDGTYGIIGMGPNSHLWKGLTDPTTNTATYSIALARISPFSYGLKQTTVASNITFGTANAGAYSGNTLTLTANANYAYPLSSMQMGVVYQTNGADSSEYFWPLNNTFPVQFTTNFKGLGLPSDLYTQVVTLLEDITGGTIDCDSTTDGTCTMPKACSEYTNFEIWTLYFQFAGQTDYMRVPLSTFAYNIKVSGGA